jgi:glutaredoxin-related protein
MPLIRHSLHLHKFLRLRQADAEAKANEARQRGYVKCPACAQIDTLRAIPPNVTTFAPGAGFSITSK